MTLLKGKQIEGFAGGNVYDSGALILSGSFSTNANSSVWTKFVATTTLDSNSSTNWDMPTGNRLRWIGADGALCRFQWFVNYDRNVSGTTRPGQIGIVKNGNSAIIYALANINFVTAGTYNRTTALSVIMTMNANDYVELWFQKIGGGSEGMRISGSDNSTFLIGEKIG